MYKVEIPLDHLQQAAINRRRKLDEERKKRIFDPKTRVFGIDVQALDEQLRIKNQINEFDRERDAAYHKYANYTNHVLTLMDAQTAEARQAHLKNINDFRTKYQTQAQGRDFDLINPDAKKKDFPGRFGDNDPRCGMSGMQKFEGEDLESKERKKEQKEQMRVWVEKTLWDKKEKERAEAELKRRYEEYQRTIATKANILSQAIHNAKKEQDLMDYQFNQHLAALKKHREAEERELTLQQNMQEIVNSMNGVFLTESPSASNVNGGHKVRVDLFKGVTKEQKMEVLQVQAYQRQENERKREQVRNEEARSALQQMNHNRALILLEREKKRHSREAAFKIRKENEQKAVHDHNRQNYIDKVLYTNPPTDAYFAQFNTTSR